MVRLAAPAVIAMVVLPSPALAQGSFTVLHAEAGRTESVDDFTETTRECDVLSAGVAAMTARNRDIQLVLDVGYRRIDTRAFGTDQKAFEYLDVGAGGRYFPRKPTIWIGSSAVVRVTAAAEAFFSYGTASNLDLPLVASAGLAISGVKPRGVLLEAVWRLTPADARYRPVSGGDIEWMRFSPWVGGRAAIFY